MLTGMLKVLYYLIEMSGMAEGGGGLETCQGTFFFVTHYCYTNYY